MGLLRVVGIPKGSVAVAFDDDGRSDGDDDDGHKDDDDAVSIDEVN